MSFMLLFALHQDEKAELPMAFEKWNEVPTFAAMCQAKAIEMGNRLTIYEDQSADDCGLVIFFAQV